jgi:hypothetical protein
MARLSAAVALILGILASFAVAGRTAAQPSDLSVIGIEATQAIQCFDQSAGYTHCPDNSLPLASDRPIAVRVYVGHVGGNCQGGTPYDPVLLGTSVTVRWVASHTSDSAGFVPSSATTSFNVPCSTKLSELREDLRGTANFVLMPEQLGNPDHERTLWIEAEVATVTVSETDLGNNLQEVTIGGGQPGGLLPASALLRIDWALVDYAPNPSRFFQPYAGDHFADAAFVGNAGGLLAALYPMPVEYAQFQYIVAYGRNPQTGEPCPAPACPDIRDDFADAAFCSSNKLLLALAEARASVSSPPDALVGWLPEDATVGAPQIRGMGTNCGFVAWVVEASPGENELRLAHEIGHTRGLDHVNADGCAPATEILEIGVDIAMLAAYLPRLQGPDGLALLATLEAAGMHFIYPASTPDFMRSSARPGDWVSPYVWSRLLERQFSREWSNQEGGDVCKL